MPEKRIAVWFRLLGLAALLSAAYFFYLLRGILAAMAVSASPSLGRGLTLMAFSYSLAIGLSGLIMIVLAQAAAGGDKTAQLGLRIVSIGLFAAMAVIFLLGHRHPLALLLTLGAAINLVGLCPFCSKMRKALFDKQ